MILCRRLKQSRAAAYGITVYFPRRSGKVAETEEKAITNFACRFDGKTLL